MSARAKNQRNRLGVIGGMSWQSTEIYYRLLNESVQQHLGGHASAAITVHSVDFAEIEALQQSGDWARTGELLAAAATALERGGADAVALATNTMHVVADDIRAAIGVPFIDLIDVVAAALTGVERVGLLGTGYTMAGDLYPKRLAPAGIEVIVPAENDAALVHRVIFDELVHGVLRPQSRAAYRDVMARLVERGAETIVLACTEIGLLIGGTDASVPVLDTTRAHCAALTQFLVAGDPA
jgi:aspartate racemase